MAGISECSALYDGNGYIDALNYRVKIDRNFKIPKEFQNEYIFDEDHEPKSKPISTMTDDNIRRLGSFNKTKLDPAFNLTQNKISAFSLNITKNDIDQYNEWLLDKSKIPTLLSSFDSEDDYIDFMNYYKDTHIPLESDPAVIKFSKSKRTFSMTDTEVYEFTTELLEGLDFGSVIGSILYSITFAHFYHLCTKDYPAHMALDDYYNEMPEKVDALAEHFLGENGAVVFGNAIQPGSDPIQYFEELKNYIISFEDQLEPEVVTDIDSYKSQIDDIVNLISSTLYKLRRLATKRTFSLA